jgi:crotonobetainyl-CoA:carnitine CoA-transferase CaiB-like acyl-CoA transferase
LAGGELPSPLGSTHRRNAPHGAFRTKDGYIAIAADSAHFGKRFCQILGLETLLDDPRFKTNGDRFANRLVLQELINENLQARTVDEWEQFLNEAGIPAGPVYAMDGALDHPQTRHREMVVERSHPVLGTVSLLGLPVKFSETPGDVHRIPPELGEHTDEILHEIGLEEDDVNRLREQKIV